MSGTPWFRFRLWAKLALFGAFGVSATHALHLQVGRDIASSAIAQEQITHAQDIARLIAAQTAEAVLVDDQVALQETVQNAVAGEHVAWCFIERDGAVLTSSFPGETPPALVELRRTRSPTAPIVVLDGKVPYLDIAAPILGGSAGSVRVGMDAVVLEKTRFKLGVLLSFVALATMLVGVIAALLVGRRMARPVKELLLAADSFDASVGGTPVVERGTDEFAELAARFNQMMSRLTAAHRQHQASVLKSAASERLVALGSLVAGVAHEVNNPLAGLRNCVSSLRWDRLPAEKQREYLELMGDALDRLDTIVRRLLDFGRPPVINIRAEWPASLAQSLSALVQPMLRQRDVEWVELDEGVASLRAMADRHQISQALLNVVLNALYVTAPGGQIRLRLRSRPGQCGISIEDDGPGIPAHQRDRVLDPFFSTKPEGEGTGLGLTVTRTIVDAHRGELTFEFPSSGGTVVTIWLPQYFERSDPAVASPAERTGKAEEG